ncbi:MAG: hypothetical protein GX362_00785, partial [Methanosarcinaceae archaeon]|nr:hypothetical protein [Methanosarcinaceae archaeon]
MNTNKTQSSKLFSKSLFTKNTLRIAILFLIIISLLPLVSSAQTQSLNDFDASNYRGFGGVDDLDDDIFDDDDDVDDDVDD